MLASPWEFSIHPCLLRGEISSISFSLPQHSAHPFFTVSSRQVNISWEWEREKKKKKKTKPPVSCPKRRKHAVHFLCKSLPNLTDTAYLKDVRSPAGITKSAGEAQGSSRLSNAVLGPGQAKATCLPALAAALALPWWAVPPAPAVGVWNAEAGTCRASSSQRLIQQQPQQRPAGHRSSPDSRWSREQAGARPQGGLFCQRSLRGREIKGLLTHQTRGLRSLNGLELKFKVTKAAGR